jgi:hypothetical protein
MTSLAAGSLQSSCPHMFVRTRTLTSWTYCARCRKTCWVGTPLRTCSLCGLYYHEQCFTDALNDTPASYNQPTGARSASVPGEDDVPDAEAWKPVAHVHELYQTTRVLPTDCDVCGKTVGLLGFSNGASYACVDCDSVFHVDCGAALPKERAVMLDTEAKMALDAPSRAQQDAMGDTLRLLAQFNEKNRNWFLTAANPLAMRRLQAQQGKLYIEACQGLPDAHLEASELLSLRRALRFATAAYGIAYHEGHMSTPFSNMIMRVARRHMMIPKSEPNNLAVTQILQLPRDALTYDKWGKSIFEPSYCLLLDHEAEWIVLAFRGSLSDADFLSDACGHLVDFCGGMAHKGMVTMIDKVFEDTVLFTSIAAQRQRHPSYRFVVTGHSLGGGLTTLFMIKMLKERTFGDQGISTPPALSDEVRKALGMRRPQPEGAVMCDWAWAAAFAPPPVVTLPLADCFDRAITSVVVAKDVVCRLQLTSIDRLGSQLAEKSDTASTVPHMADGVEECFICGSILFSTKPNHVRTRLTHLDRASLLLRDIFVSTYMVTNHIMDSYGRALAAVASSAATTPERARTPANTDEPHDAPPLNAAAAAAEEEALDDAEGFVSVPRR